MNLKIKKIVASTLAVASFMPVFAFAEEVVTSSTTSTTAQVTAPQPGKNFCTNLTKVSQELQKQTTSKEEKQLTKEAELQSKTTKKQLEADEKLAANRTKADGERAKKEANMKTDAGKTYSLSIEGAVATRKAAVDTAVAAYRIGLNTAMEANKANADKAVTDFKTAVNTAITKATADCAGGVSGTIVGKAFNQSLKEARTAFSQAKKTINNTGAIKSLKKTRDDAIAKAITEFKAAQVTAQKTMKTAAVQMKADLKMKNTVKENKKAEAVQ